MITVQYPNYGRFDVEIKLLAYYNEFKKKIF
jgi:hypothetical protein